jgi:hypothetical protein
VFFWAAKKTIFIFVLLDFIIIKHNVFFCSFCLFYIIDVKILLSCWVILKSAMLRQRRLSNDQSETHCHFAYFYIILGMSVIAVICGKLHPHMNQSQ